MNTRTRYQATLGMAATVAMLALLGGQALAASTLSPLPASDYTVRSACPPPAPGHVSCLALRLIARSAAARAHTHPLGITRTVASGAGAASAVCEPPTAAEGCFGLRPKDLHSAYQLPTGAPTTQTIALVDAYNDPTAESDLKVYDEEFDLSECTHANGCFSQVNQQGEEGQPPFPKTPAELEAAHISEPEEAEEAEGWSIEMSLDIETARATCQSCKILLVEADSTQGTGLESAERTAVRLGAEEVSNSWGGPECIQAGACVEDSSAFNHPGVVITASAGDDGYLSWDSSQPSFPEFPASSPQVVAVGGTRLLMSAAGAWKSETVWNDGGESGGVKEGHGAGGGGCSVEFAAQPWQQSVSDWSSVGCSDHRAVADVSADADPYTGLAVYDSSSEECASEDGASIVHWCTIGGTSLASPLIASVFALAGGAHGVNYPAQTLYENLAATPGSLHDVTAGSNGECTKPFDENTGQSGCSASEEAANSCASRLICAADTGYDGPSGVGTPDGIAAFQPLPEGASEKPKGSGESKGSEDPLTPGRIVPGGPLASFSPTGAGSGSHTTTGATPGASPAVQLSGLALTLKAILALNTGRPRIPQVSFTFISNLATRINASLQKRVEERRHTSWRAIVHTLTINAVSGHNTHHLGGHGALSPGTYRLTLTPVNGSARSLEFKIG